MRIERTISCSVIAAMACYIFYLKDCTGYNVKTETTTTYAHVKSEVHSIPVAKSVDTPTVFADHSHIPDIVQKGKTVYEPIPKQRNWLMRFFSKPADTIAHNDAKDYFDTAAIFQDYYSVRKYSDTIPNKYGKTIINESISENKIASRDVQSIFDIPMQTTRTTLTPKPSNRLYLGIGVGTAFGLNATLITKSESMYSANLYWNFRGTNLVISKSWKIHL
jgi:hypothetical protein